MFRLKVPSLLQEGIRESDCCQGKRDIGLAGQGQVWQIGCLGDEEAALASEH